MVGLNARSDKKISRLIQTVPPSEIGEKSATRKL